MDLETRNMLSILFIKNCSSRLCLVKCYVKLVFLGAFPLSTEKTKQGLVRGSFIVMYTGELTSLMEKVISVS